MAAARASDRPLALALVVLRDTEAIEARGRKAVAAAERALFERLRRAEGSARVERFGELMAGVFCHAGPAFVEGWVERVAAAGPPVHVGVALLRARHLDAESLRADAAAALRAAYERGEDCVILE
jgi:triphosphoribosyl-dephospho-CoA synthetase